jgi:hypothetical protein
VDPERDGVRERAMTGAAPGAPSRDSHDRAVRFIAANRFPFPGQSDWLPDSVTLTNETRPVRGIDTPEGVHYPDIVILSGSGAIREVAEVETEVDDGRARIWRVGSLAADTKTKSGVRHFFVYVPAGLEGDALRLLERHGISYAGVRTWTVGADGLIRVVPIRTPGDPKDHVESVETP